jgi:hypothetical protein
MQEATSSPSTQNRSVPFKMTDHSRMIAAICLRLRRFKLNLFEKSHEFGGFLGVVGPTRLTEPEEFDDVHTAFTLLQRRDQTVFPVQFLANCLCVSPACWRRSTSVRQRRSLC